MIVATRAEIFLRPQTHWDQISRKIKWNSKNLSPGNHENLFASSPKAKSQ